MELLVMVSLNWKLYQSEWNYYSLTSYGINIFLMFSKLFLIYFV